MRNSNNIVMVSIFLLSSYIIGLVCPRAIAKEGKNSSGPIQPQNPYHEIRLNLKEFSVLNSAARFGINKYGGVADFRVRLAKDSNEVVWTINITDPRLIEVWQYWTAEKTVELVNILDFDKLDAASKAALDTVKSLNAKIAQARANPIWDPVKLSGKLIEDKDKLFIENNNTRYKITGDKFEAMKILKGKRVIISGIIKVKDQIEVIDFWKKKVNTLEVFVMSLCPFSKMSETSIIEFLDNYSGNATPRLEIHYIFYQKIEGGKKIFTSLHSEEEVRENLIQMIIRDMYPQFYYKYLLHRAKSEASWDKLANKVGMTTEDIKLVQNVIKEDRDSLIQAEYEYVTGKYQIYDGSPTYVWESEKVEDIRKIEVFNNLKFTGEPCSER